MYWKIWLELYQNDKKVGSGVWHRRYKYKGNAVRAAKKLFGEEHINERTGKVYRYNWVVSQTNPRRTRPEQLSFMD